MTSIKTSTQKRQLLLAISLFGIVAVLGTWELHGALAHVPTARAALPGTAHMRNAAATQQGKASTALSYRLQLDQLAASEGRIYAPEGKDVFAASAAPIEAALAPPRPAVAETPEPTAPQVVAAPAFDIKYLGFTEANHGPKSALFTHGDDIAAGLNGDILFHRFRVDMVQASAAQVTDLTTNRTQSLSIPGN